MGIILSGLLVTVAGLFAIPAFLLFIEVIASSAAPRCRSLPVEKRPHPRVAVLVPAHNEAKGLLQVLQGIQSQLRADDRLLVVADNCTDDTAAIAKGVGAEVVERNNPALIGKGYALAWGLRYLERDPPEVVIVVDADCRLGNEALEQIAAVCAQTQRPVQARYCMNAPDRSPIDYNVATFAFRVKNWTRPMGLRALNLPCQLMGSGMAFPWSIIHLIDFATGSEVEDLTLGLAFAKAGRPPLFLPSAVVSSEFPMSIGGAKTQRRRWERGHLQMIAMTAPQLLLGGAVAFNIPLLALVFDLMIPPLTLLGLAGFSTFLLTMLGFLAGLSAVSMFVSVAGLAAYLIAVLICWRTSGRDLLARGFISSVVSFVATKFLIYPRVFKNAEWIRTDRDKPSGGLN